MHRKTHSAGPTPGTRQSSVLTMAGLTVVAVVILQVFSTAKAVETANGPGLITECLMDLSGARATCASICLAEYILNDLSRLNPVGKCIVDATASYVDSSTSFFQSNPDYSAIYDRLIANRRGMCGLLDSVMPCVNPLVHSACGTFGDSEITGIENFLKSQLDCNNPTSTTMVTCLTSPRLINEIVKDLETGVAPKHVCIKRILEEPFVTGLISILANSSTWTEMDIMEKILGYIRTEKTKLCNLIDSTTTCFKDELRRVAGGHCSETNLDAFQKQVDSLKNMIVGCSGESYYDLFTCGMDLALWKKVIGLGMQASCPLNSTMIMNSFSAALANSGGSINVMNDGFCEIVTFVECLAGEIKNKYGEQLAWEMVMSILKPFREWVDYKQNCPGRLRINSLPTCKCLDNTFQIGSNFAGQCTLTQRDRYQCGGKVLKAGENGENAGCVSAKAQLSLMLALVVLIITQHA